MCLHQINTRAMLFHISYKKKFMVSFTASRLAFHIGVCVKLRVRKRTRHDADVDVFIGAID